MTNKYQKTPIVSDLFSPGLAKTNLGFSKIVRKKGICFFLNIGKVTQSFVAVFLGILTAEYVFKILNLKIPGKWMGLVVYAVPSFIFLGLISWIKKLFPVITGTVVDSEIALKNVMVYKLNYDSGGANGYRDVFLKDNFYCIRLVVKIGNDSSIVPAMNYAFLNQTRAEEFVNILKNNGLKLRYFKPFRIYWVDNKNNYNQQYTPRWGVDHVADYTHTRFYY